MMRPLAYTLVFIIIVLALSIVVRAEPAETAEILLRPVDSGYVSHIELVPRPRYTHRELSCSEVSKELLLKALYGDGLDQGMLSFVLRSYRGGYFSRSPSDEAPDMEATFYATWLLETIGVEKTVNASLLESVLCRTEEFTQAYYAYRTLRLLGYNVTLDCLEDWSLGYAVSFIRGARAPDARSTMLWLLLEWDPGKAGWLAKRGIYVPPPGAEASEYSGLDYSDWYYIELLIQRRPVYVNATVWPRIVVGQQPRLISCSAVRWPSEKVELSYSWRIENGTIVSLIVSGERRIELRHVLARKEYAALKITQRPGQLVVSTSYKPPYNLTLIIAGKKYTWRSEGYDLNATLELPAYGTLRVYAELKARNVVLRGRGEIRLETSPERSLLDAAFVALPLAAITPSIASSRRKRRLGFSMFLLAAPIPLSWNLLLEVHPLWVTLGYGLAVLASIYVLDREAFWRAAGHILVAVLLASASMLLGNPLIIVLGGVGSALFLVSGILYPSELAKTEKMYRSSMTLYALGMLVMGAVVEASTSIASMMWAPDSGFVSSIEVQAMFLADLFALTPVLAGVWHLARLIHSYERAREAREMLDRLVPST